MSSSNVSHHSVNLPSPLPLLLLCLFFSDSCFLPYTFTGYNNMYGYQYVKLYSDQDVSSAMYIRYIRLDFGFNSPFESNVSDLSTS